jgi:superfamily II DNA or RNA helicase
MQLRPYQVDAVSATLSDWQTSDRLLGILPTGGGKTICFSHVVAERRKSGRCLVIAHREELIDQALDKMRKATGIWGAKEKAEHRASMLADVVVGSVQTLQGKRLARFPRDHFKTVVIDECHHATASTYQRLLKHFDGAKVLGVTATPDRADEVNLGSYFEKVSFEVSLLELIQKGFLSKIVAKTLPIKIDLTQVKTTAGDFQAAGLGDAINPILNKAADLLAEHANNRKGLIFLPLIHTSQKMNDAMVKNGFSSAWISGDDPLRKEKLESFRNNEIRWMCNSMLLTEGFDMPDIDCIVVLRPTKSRALYSQMVGRGTRIHEGKENVLVIDFLYQTVKHNLMRPANLIAEDPEEVEGITEMLNKRGGGQMELDIMQAATDATEQRERKLREALERAAKKKARLMDPVEFGLTVHADAVADFEPDKPWHYEAVSDKQRSIIERFGIKADGMLRGQASALLDIIFARSKAKLANPEILKSLKAAGHPSPNTVTQSDAISWLKDPRPEKIFVPMF